MVLLNWCLLLLVEVYFHHGVSKEELFSSAGDSGNEL
jgi:hypothetical protein